MILNADIWFVPRYWKRDGVEIVFNLYRINKCGEVYSLLSNRKMKIQTTFDGYGRLQLKNEDLGSVYCRRARLVACTFIENNERELKWQVDHNDRNKKNDCVYNLEWVTPKENALRIHKSIDELEITENIIEIPINQLSLFPDEKN